MTGRRRGKGVTGNQATVFHFQEIFLLYGLIGISGNAFKAGIQINRNEI